MDFKDYYAMLGVERTATQAEIKGAYRKLARKYHPDVSKEPDAEARFKDVAEAHEALHDVERRAAYDDAAAQQKMGRNFDPTAGRDQGFEFSGWADGRGSNSDFFESLFGRRPTAGSGHRGDQAAAGGDHHAKVRIDLQDAYHGGRRTISLRSAQRGLDGHMTLQTRQLEVNIPKGVRDGQHLRLRGQGGVGSGGAAAGDLFLEIEFLPHARFRVDDRDVYLDVPVAPWEAALGATITVATPDGSVELAVPAASSTGRKLRLKGKGIPGQPAGDLYVVLSITLPPVTTTADQEAYREMAKAFTAFEPRAAQEPG